MSNATPTLLAAPADLATEPILCFPRPARLPVIEPDLPALIAQWGDFSESETATLVNRASWLMRCGASPAGAVEDAVAELLDGSLR